MYDHSIVVVLQGAKESNVAGRSHQRRRGGVCDEGGRRAKRRRTRVRRAESEPQTWRHVTHNNVHRLKISLKKYYIGTASDVIGRSERARTSVLCCVSVDLSLYFKEQVFSARRLPLADWKLRTVALSQHQR